ncbi:MAG TPA: gephyrin-like molybdotransferase Glp [Vicinamibacterales bacterium]|nr:gephyrin-like molybdotransferase Glp [Vicinamibacterales bacterium]
MTTSRMRPIRHTIALDEARRRLDEAVVPIERTERVALTDAGGRVAARDVPSPRDVPPFDRAAMDGYAVIAADTFDASRSNPKRLLCLETVYTGDLPSIRLTHGHCIEIATGAPLPAGADAVVMVEETEKDEAGTVEIFSAVHPGQHIGRQAADLALGQTVVARGDHLNPGRVGALAAVGLADVEVFARPRVAILSTGNELVDPGQPLPPGRIYDVNRFTLAAIIGDHGGVPVPFRTAQDTLEALHVALNACLAEDIVVFSGGSSVGERDLMLDAVAASGEIVFHGIAVKPGKPTIFGRIAGKPVFGMPGYPTSCLSNGYALLVPFLRRLARLPPYRPAIVRAPLARRIVSTTGRHQFYTVRLVHGQAEPAFKASGDITSMSRADGYIEISAQVEIVEKGELVDVSLF